MTKRLLLIGGGGHCHSIIDSVLSLNIYDEVGIIDGSENSYLGVHVIGTDEDVPKLFNEGWSEAFIAVGSVGDTHNRRKLFEMVKKIGMALPTIVDPTAVIGKDTIIGEGTYVGKKAVINVGSTVGTCAIINTGAILEHDTIVGDFAHISPGAVLCGQVSIGNDSHIGAGSIVRQLNKVGNSSLIGAGSIVVKDIPSYVKAYGNPCKVVE